MNNVLPTSNYYRYDNNDNDLEDDNNTVNWKKHTFTIIATCITFLLAYRFNPNHYHNDNAPIVIKYYSTRISQIPNQQSEQTNDVEGNYNDDNNRYQIADEASSVLSSLLSSSYEQEKETIQDFQIPIQLMDDKRIRNNNNNNPGRTSISIKQTKQESEEDQYNSNDKSDRSIDLKFKRMSGYNPNNLSEYFDAYIHDDVRNFYHDDNDNSNDYYQEQIPEFNGQAGKFINLFPYRISLYWEDPINGQLVFQSDINS